MQTAYLYIRVSTDEQAIKGYSLPFQEKKLQDYCSLHNIHVLEIIKEDYSARTFSRPAWLRLMRKLSQNKSLHPDLLLFTKWDRFSRNVSDAYYMIRQLERIGIAPQAIEQPLDLSVPENKILLAVYVATSEVENERRSLNVRQGIHEAREEGKWTSHPPLGFTCQYTSNGQRYLALKEPEASFIKIAFTLIATNPDRSIQSIYEQLLHLGIKCSRSHFWRILQQPAYCGKVWVTSFNGEQAHLVKGLHQGIISDLLFQKVQKILQERKRHPAIRGKPTDKLILKGFIYCPTCGNRLTGSRSKGKHAYYFYYHCHRCKHFRVRADRINNFFQAELNKLIAGPDYINIYRCILQYVEEETSEERSGTEKILSKNINQLLGRVIKARALLSNAEIKNEDFIIIKTDCEKQIKQLALDLQKSAAIQKASRGKQHKVMKQLSNPGYFWSESDIVTKKRLLSVLIDSKIVLMDNLELTEHLNRPTQTVYNLPMLNSDKELIRLGWFNINETMNSELITKVIICERKKQNNLCTENAQYIVDFLVNMVLLSAGVV